jgi:hypothetical protein
MPKLFGQVISRVTMALVAAGLIFGGIKSLRAGARITADFYQNQYQSSYDIRHDDRHHPSRPDTSLRNIGWALIGAGIFLAFASVVPVSVLQKFFETFSSPPQIGDN